MSETLGGYDIDGKVTPFSQEPVPQINAATWHTASITDLWEQMGVLNARYIAVAQMGKPEYMVPLKQAMAELEVVIRQRTQNNENKIT